MRGDGWVKGSDKIVEEYNYVNIFDGTQLLHGRWKRAYWTALRRFPFQPI